MQDDAASLKLTPEEQSAHTWFSGYRSKLQFFKQLSPEDKALIDNKEKYDNNPVAMTRLNNNYIDAFYRAAQEAGVELKYTREILKRANLKVMRLIQSKTEEEVTDLPSARRQAWKNIPEHEQDTFRPTNYRNNPKAAEAVALKFSQDIVKRLVSIKLVEDTEEAKKKRVDELYAEQLETFKSHY